MSLFLTLFQEAPATEAAKVLEDCSRDYVSTESTEVSPPVERDTSREPSPSDKS